MIMSQHGSVSVSVTVDNIIEFATDSFLKSAADSFRRGPEGRLPNVQPSRAGMAITMIASAVGAALLLRCKGASDGVAKLTMAKFLPKGTTVPAPP